jgi:dihydroxyacetone kinase phosphotransfer subunit
MVGIVVVSHSPDLARAAVSLALQMVPGPPPSIQVAAGTSDDRFGTDAVRVAEAITAADDGHGVVVIMDLGSAVLSAELALELVSNASTKIRLVPAAFVEGIFAAVISAAAGAELDVVARDAESALHAKVGQLDQAQLDHAQPQVDAVPVITRPAIVAEATIVNTDGIHARPAALIVDALGSSDAQVTIATERSAPVSARSPTALMSLGTRAGDVLRIEADGAGAAAAVDQILALVRDGFGEVPAEPFDRLRMVPVEAPTLHPMGVSPGRVVGPAVRMPDPIAEPDPTLRIPETERPAAVTRLRNAATEVAEQLRGRSVAAGTVGKLLEAIAAIATDPELLADASTRVRDRGLTPERAVWEAMEVAADSMRAVGSRQALRVSDLYGVRDRIIALLTGRAAASVPDPGHPFVLLTIDLAPADAAELDPRRCLAIVTEEGGPTSHTAIIARSLGIPAVVAQTARGIGLPVIGVMVETPAAALQAVQILTEVDFVSIGTNDLAQYTFAADRNSADLASLTDPWQPALLRMIELVASAAAGSGKPVGVCGEAAADPLLALVLTGLGISTLSVAPAALAKVGRELGAVTLELCQWAARAACDSDSPASARKAVRQMVEMVGP